AADDAANHCHSTAHRAGSGLPALFADQVSRPELSGESVVQTRVCLVPYGADVGSTSRFLAHEFGHLLGLGHADAARREGPGQERQAAAWMRNLMNSGALDPDAELTPDQVRQARSSDLARRFGGP